MIHKRVVLVDDHPVVLAGISELVGQLPRCKVIATGSTADEAVQLHQTHAPDLIVVDLHMPGDVLAAISCISESDRACPIIVFTASDLIADCTAAMAHGAKGYVVKGASGNEFFQSLDVVMDGREYISVDLAARMVRELRQQKTRDCEVKLNHREEQIVRQLMLGSSNKDIADELHLSEKTVKYYMTQIMQKLNVQNRVQVVLAAQTRFGGEAADLR